MSASRLPARVREREVKREVSKQIGSREGVARLFSSDKRRKPDIADVQASSLFLQDSSVGFAPLIQRVYFGKRPVTSSYKRLENEIPLTLS